MSQIKYEVHTYYFTVTRKSRMHYKFQHNVKLKTIKLIDYNVKIINFNFINPS